MNGGAQMFKRLAESKAQPGKAAQMCPHAQVGAFDVAGTDVFKFRVSANWYRDNGLYVGGVVPLRPFRVGFPIEFEQLREVNVRAKAFLDGGNVPAQTVRRNLETSDNALTQVADEVVRACRNALPDEVGQNHFRFGINRHPNVLIAPFARNVAVEMPFLRVYEGPKFIGLDESRSDISHAGVKQGAALASYCEEQGKNRGFVDASGTRYSPDAHSFQQERDNLRGFLGRDAVPSKRSIARLGESAFTSGAAITLDSVASVESKPLCFGVFAANTSHFRPCLSCGGSRKCFLRSALRLTPRADLAPLPAVTGSGDFSIYSFRETTYPLPLIGQAIVFSFDFLALEQTLKQRMDARHYIFLPAEVLSHVYELLFNLNWREGFSGGLKNLARGIGNAHALDIRVDCRQLCSQTIVGKLLTERRKSYKGLPEPCETALYDFLLNFQGFNVCLYFLGHFSVFGRVHEGSIRWQLNVVN